MRLALMLSLWLLITLICVAGCGQHIARPKNKEDVSPKQVERAAQSFTTEAHFLERTAQVVRTQIELAKLAQSKAQNPDVKAYAERMLKDYTAMQNDLEKLAQSQNVTLPSNLDVNQQSLVAKLESKSGNDFDKTYMRAEVDGHQGMITQLQGAIERAQSPPLKDFATVNLITVRDHGDEARSIAKKVGA